MPDFGYAREKFRTARRTLMPPFRRGVPEAIASAFHECQLGMMNIKPEDIPNEGARAQFEQLQDYMNTDDVADSPNGRWAAKAATFDDDQVADISDLVDELSWWFGEFRNA